MMSNKIGIGAYIVAYLAHKGTPVYSACTTRHIKTLGHWKLILTGQAQSCAIATHHKAKCHGRARVWEGD